MVNSLNSLPEGKRKQAGMALLVGAAAIYGLAFMIQDRPYQETTVRSAPYVVPQPPSQTTVQSTAAWRPFSCYLRGNPNPYKVIPQAQVAPEQFTTRHGNVVTWRVMTPDHPNVENAIPVSVDLSVAICGYERNQLPQPSQQ